MPELIYADQNNLEGVNLKPIYPAVISITTGCAHRITGYEIKYGF
jgi:hypothetical protein